MASNQVQTNRQKEAVGAALASRTECSHTPGPWVAVKNSCYWEVRSELHGMVGDACASNHIHVDGEKLPEDEAARFAEANARLFAAAPTMYEALQEADDDLCSLGYGEYTATRRVIRAAIASAKVGGCVMVDHPQIKNWVRAMADTLAGYQCDLGEDLPDDHELGRIEESRHSASFRIRVGHIRQLIALFDERAA